MISAEKGERRLPLQASRSRERDPERGVTCLGWGWGQAVCSGVGCLAGTELGNKSESSRNKLQEEMSLGKGGNRGHSVRTLLYELTANNSPRRRKGELGS